ncbi:hypothetical protein [Selenomonas ruminantium]|uniref:hypothetical protein n=1 Tax=Selenomonas ruminantium TaxID=971 RepID=UPI0026EA5D92|nr:hypothetical protein [Selenomonas ruminantium]
MAKVAKLYGKKLGEEFLLKNEKNAIFPYVFTEDGLFYIENGKPSINDSHELMKLLTGNSVIVKDIPK